MKKKATIFISYSHKDEKEKNELIAHLSVLQGAGLVDVWSDDRIQGGADWESEIRQTMEQARVAILLVTVHFLTSDFILREEVPKLLRRRQTQNLETFPVIAKACAWRRVDWLTQMNVRPKNGSPVWRDRGQYVDDELARIVEEVADILETKTYQEPVTADLGSVSPWREQGGATVSPGGTTVSAEAQRAVEACLVRHLSHCDPTLSRRSAQRVAEAVQVAFSRPSMDLASLRRSLSDADSDPRLLSWARRLLREPALQRLARRAGHGDDYERLAFDLSTK